MWSGWDCLLENLDSYQLLEGNKSYLESCQLSLEYLENVTSSYRSLLASTSFQTSEESLGGFISTSGLLSTSLFSSHFHSYHKHILLILFNFGNHKYYSISNNSFRDVEVITKYRHEKFKFIDEHVYSGKQILNHFC